MLPVLVAAFCATRRGAMHFGFVPIVFAVWLAAVGPWHGWVRWAVAAVAALVAFVVGAQANRAAGAAVAAVVALSALVPAWVPSSGTAPLRPSALAVDRYLRREVDRAQIPGVAVAIVRRGRIVFTHGYGTASNGEDMTARTPVVIGSTSKSITATAVMRLAIEGKLGLDSPVREWLPWFRPRDARARDITIRHLLVDTSGIPTFAGWSALGGSGSADVRALVNDVRLTAAPGKKFQYANANYILLGEIIAAATGESYATAVQRLVFDPLALSNTRAEAQARNANRYWFGAPIRSRLPYLEVGLPAGAITSTARDLGRYLVAQMAHGDGLVAAKDAVAFDELQIAAVKAGGFNVPQGRSYAMGWYVGKLGGRHAVFHSGDAFDSSSSLVMIPGAEVGVAVVANTSSALTPVAKTLAEGATAVLLAQRPPRLSPALALSQGTAVVAGAAVLALAVMRTRRLVVRRERGSVARVVVLDLLAPLAVFFGLPLLFSRFLDRAETVSPLVFWRIVERVLPDVAVLVFAALLLRIGAGVVGLVRRRAPEPERAPWTAPTAAG